MDVALTDYQKAIRRHRDLADAVPGSDDWIERKNLADWLDCVEDVIVEYGLDEEDFHVW